jgi:hypothetical protein
MTSNQKDAGIVAVKPATHVNYAQQTEKNAVNARRLVILQEYAAQRRAQNRLKPDASHSTQILQLVLQA